MSVKQYFSCDLCRSSIPDASNGIGITHAAMGNIKPVYLHDGSYHLCNPCVQGVRLMIAELDRSAQIYAARELAEERDRSGSPASTESE